MHFFLLINIKNKNGHIDIISEAMQLLNHNKAVNPSSPRSLRLVCLQYTWVEKYQQTIN